MDSVGGSEHRFSP
jgi:hypothetical protein